MSRRDRKRQPRRVRGPRSLAFVGEIGDHFRLDPPGRRAGGRSGVGDRLGASKARVRMLMNPSEPSAPAAPGRFVRGDLPAAIGCAAFCVVLFLLPHLVSYLCTGDPAWIADPDDRLYLNVASRAVPLSPVPGLGPDRRFGGIAVCLDLDDPGRADGEGAGPGCDGDRHRVAGPRRADDPAGAVFLVRQFVARPVVAAAP